MIMLGRADMANSLMYFKGLHEQLSRYLEFDRRHKVSVLVFRIKNCCIIINAANQKYNNRPS
jgi:hypothetical protein